MEVLKITAVDNFSHGRLNMTRGESATIEASEARELEKVGLVSTEPADGESIDDLVAGDKMEPMTSNKMGAAPKNKKK